MLITGQTNSLKRFHIQQEEQLDIVSFESPLQQVLQQKALLLRLLNQQNRWQLWLSMRPMLKRSWIQRAGLTEQKVMHIANANQSNIIQIIEKALLSQTCSYIVACVDHIDQTDKQRLQMAVKSSGTHLFLIDDNFMNHNDFMTLSKTMSKPH